MLTQMTEADWKIVLVVFRGCLPRRGDKAWDDRRFLEARHLFTPQNVSWRPLSAEDGNWNTVWKRFSRLSGSGVFEAFFQAPAELSSTAHLVQMFDSTTVRAHISAAGAKRRQQNQALGRSRGGFTTKVHLKTDFDAGASPLSSRCTRSRPIVRNTSRRPSTKAGHGSSGRSEG